MLKRAEFALVPASRLADYQFITGHFGFEYIKDIIDSSYSFTFLREPVQRVLSLYTYCREMGSNKVTASFPIFESAQRMSIDEFVLCEDPTSGIPASIDNTQTWQLAKHYNVAERSRIPPLSEPALYELAVGNLAKFSHVGFQEEFFLHLQRILIDLGYSSPNSTGFVNVTASPVSADALRPKTLASLRERVRLDLALYDYARAEYGLFGE
jgi:hypothetical protein